MNFLLLWAVLAASAVSYAVGFARGVRWRADLSRRMRGAYRRHLR